MANVNGPWIELNATEMRAFHEQMRHPDREAARRRDAFLEEIHRNPWQENSDGSYEFDVDIELAKEKIEDCTTEKTATAMRSSGMPDAFAVTKEMMDEMALKAA